MHPNRPGYKYFGSPDGRIGRGGSLLPIDGMDTLSRDIARYSAAPHQAWVWALPLADLPAGALGIFNVVLGQDERNRAAAFHFEKDALAYAAAHALLRWSLSLRHGGAPRAWRFASDALGKPSLATPPTARDTRFSLSHTEGLVAVALAEGFDIGVDTEAMKVRGDLIEVADECFSVSERVQLAQADAGFVSDAERFYAFWTLKEALLKAKGLGLNQAPSTFSVDLRSMGVTVPPALAPVHAWQLQCRKVTADHFVSIALDAPPDVREAPISVISNAASWLDALGHDGGA